MGSGDFLSERDGIVLARATKPSAFRSAFEVRHEGRTYELAKESVSQRRSLPLKVFVIWLVVILWKRAAAAAS